MEVINALPEIREIARATSDFLNTSLSVMVVDDESCKVANALFLDADRRLKAIDIKLDPKRKLAYQAYQEWLKLIKELKDPYTRGKEHLDTQISTYRRAQEEIRKKEEERLRQEAIKAEMERRKAEEEAKLQAAAELEAAGATYEAEQIMAEALEEVQKPIEVYVPPTTTPRVVLSGATVKEYWSAEVVDLKALCRAVAEGRAPLAAIEANMVFLNAQARSLKKEMNIPGVRAVSENKMAATGR